MRNRFGTLALSAIAIAFWYLVGLFGFTKPRSPEVRGISRIRVNRNNEEKKVQLEIGLEVFNPNPYKMKVLEYDLDVFVNGKPLGKVAERRISVMQKEDDSQVTFGVRTDLKKVLGGIGGLVGGLISGLVSGEKEVDVRVKGYVKARARGIDRKVPVDFEKSYEL